jgi:hypothetical protein
LEQSRAQVGAAAALPSTPVVGALRRCGMRRPTHSVCGRRSLAPFLDHGGNEVETRSNFRSSSVPSVGVGALQYCERCILSLKLGLSRP